MGSANLHAWKAIERSVENHSREEKCRFQRVADHVSEIAESALLDDICRVLRMHENQNTEFLNLGPERIVFGRGWHFAACMPGDPDAPQSQFSDGFIQLIRCHLGMLQGNGCQTYK